jgi:hypothetical protein
MLVLLEALDVLGVDQCKFNDWCIDIRKGFLQRNAIALPIQVLVRSGYDGLDEVQIDARSFLTQMNTLMRAYAAQANQLGSIGEDVRQLIDQQDRLEKKFDRVIKLMESRTLNQGEKSERLVYSDAIASYKPSTPARLFVQFFRDSLHVLYHVQLKMAKWKCLSQKDRGKVSTNFRRQKKCTRYMLCFLSLFPTTPPNIGDAYTDWLKMINLQAEAAERGILEYWNKKCGKSAEKLTFSMIESSALEELDSRFVERPPDGITPADLELFRNNLK